MSDWLGIIEHKISNEYYWVKTAKPWIGVIAASLPALGAALTGIRYQLDFDGKAASCQEMVDKLQALLDEIERAKEKQDFDTTRAAILKCSQVLAEDVDEFLSLYGRKQLTLPG